uniref:Ankyrin repeat domain 52 n=1 Tax=Sphaeramia orbicularis TaxID=375764 RepID=A0A673ASZ8_9TELE
MSLGSIQFSEHIQFIFTSFLKYPVCHVVLYVLYVKCLFQSPLVQAIFNRNAEEVEFLLNHNEDASTLDQEQSTPLHAAAYLGDVQVMDLLITSGASVNAEDQGLLSPLHRAAASRNERAVELLLEHEAEVNVRDKFWHTPLHMAAANWATGCAVALISHMSNVDAVDRSGRTPLHHAAYSGHVAMVNLLQSKGANVGARDKNERQPIHWAAFLGHMEVVKLLLSHSADAMCKDKCGYTSLHAAAASGQLDVVKYLLKLGVEIDEPNNSGHTALHMACHMGQDSVAVELVNYGANINQPNLHGDTPLHLAAASSSGVLCLELLINNGADVNMQNKEGKSPLHMAAMHGRFTGSQILIQNGGEIDCVDNYGNSPLHVAARHGQELLISTLLTNGADKTRQGIHGMLPLHLAALYGFPDCCRKLLSSGQLYNIMPSLLTSQTSTSGFDINTPDDHGRTCLHAAASGGNVDCLNLLLSGGAELDVRDNLGRSALHYAAANGNSQCTISLVRAGAEVNELDLTGCSPLHYAAASHTFCGDDPNLNLEFRLEKEQEASLCLDFLLDNGANPTLKNTKGYSAVHFAAAYGNKQHLELLLEISFNCLEEVESNIPVSPLHLAAYYGHCDALRLLCETLVSLDVRDIEGQTALHLAAKRGFTQCVEVLLKHQASYTVKEHKHKRTALHAAAAEGHVDCLLLLVNKEQSADVIDSPDTQGQTALMLATLGRHIDCVHILLEKGAKADAADKKGFTALHRKCAFSFSPMFLMCFSCDCVSALLDHGASALCRDSQGMTPLHLAASCGHTDVLHSLLKAAVKADPLDSMLDYRGHTPTHWAAYHGETDSKILAKSGRLKEIPSLHCTVVNGHEVAAELLLKTVGPQIVNVCDAKGRTPLHAAAYSGNVAGLQLVLAHEAEVNAVDHSGCSALMVAADCGQTRAGHEMCALLILGEISDSSLINATNSSLQMPLHIAARRGLATVVQVLLSRGAAVMAVDEQGHTPALACAPNKNVADCLALILSTMKPFPPREACTGTASHFNPILKNCGIAATCGSSGSMCHTYVKDRPSTVGLHGCMTE